MREVDPGGGCQSVLLLLVAMVTILLLAGIVYGAYFWASR